MSHQLKSDPERANLRPLVDEALRIVDQMGDLFPHKHGALRMARAHVRARAENGTNVQFFTECLSFIGMLRGVHRAYKIAYPAQHLENDLRELLKSYRAAHVLITTKDTHLW